MESMMQWACGLTTVPERFDLFQQTLASLASAGFEHPTVFVDGVRHDARYDKLEHVVYRYPRIRTAGNWWLGLLELYLRNAAPNPSVGKGPADRYAMFQDDFVCSKNLREYLERTTVQEKCYWNLYTFPENERQPGAAEGRWYESNQLGKGAVALVFTAQAVQTLFMSYHWVHRPMDYHRGYRAIDGGIVDSFRKAGWKEMVHLPSLVQHMGFETSIQVNPNDSKHPKQPQAPSFKGTDFDLLTLPVHAYGEQAVATADPDVWAAEEQALERAIKADQERLANADSPRARALLNGHISRYQRQLIQHRRMKPAGVANVVGR